MLIHTKVLLALSTSIARGAAQLHTVIWEQETNKHRFVTVQIVPRQMLRAWLWLQTYEEALEAIKSQKHCKGAKMP